MTADTTALVIALHGRGANELSMDGLTSVVPPSAAMVAARAPISEGDGYAWFANRGIGRPLPESIADTISLMTAWLDELPDLPLYLLGFSGGTAMAGGLLLAEPSRYQGAVLLSGTLPLDASLPTVPGRLTGVPVFFARGAEDRVIPGELFARSHDYLAEESGAALTERIYPGLGHSISPRMGSDVGAWLEGLVRRH
ncbi:dienelactone hydrolase family protein [Acidothermaceae bacterium B102]|nr:dienelactone hydrolase family protein [Acidothermaceae bacterium B102]